MILAGAPTATDRGGILASPSTEEPTPRVECLPIRAPSKIIAPTPMRHSSPTRQACTTALCATVTPSPMIVGSSAEQWITTLSWMLQSEPRLLRTLIEYEILRLQDLLELVHRDVDLDLFLRPGADELPAGEEEYDDLRLVHPVDQSRKLFRLVHGLLETVNGFL